MLLSMQPNVRDEIGSCCTPGRVAQTIRCKMHYRQPAVAHRERATGRPAARHGRPALDAAHREGRDQVPVRHADVSPSSVAATASGRMGDGMRRREREPLKISENEDLRGRTAVIVALRWQRSFLPDLTLHGVRARAALSAIWC